MKPFVRRPVAAVVGATSASELILAAAEDIGKGLVDAGFRVATGGLGGVMTAASRGASGPAACSEKISDEKRACTVEHDLAARHVARA